VKRTQRTKTKDFIIEIAGYGADWYFHIYPEKRKYEGWAIHSGRTYPSALSAKRAAGRVMDSLYFICPQYKFK